MSKRALGKGLGTLLSSSSSAQKKLEFSSQSEEILQEVAIELLQPGANQPRKDMSEEALQELSDSIKSQGVIQPILVRQLNGSQYEIIAGERRWRASKLAGLKQVPCLVREISDKSAIAIGLIENIQREDLNAIEEAASLERLQKEFSLTHNEIAEIVGKSRTAVSNLLRLNQLSSPIKSMLVSKELEMGHARALLSLDNEKQQEVAEEINRKQLTVRQTEQLIREINDSSNDKKKASKVIFTKEKELSKQLTDQLGVKVNLIKADNGQAKLTININEQDKLNYLLKLLTQ